MKKSNFEQGKELGFPINPYFNKRKIYENKLSKDTNDRLKKKINTLDLLFLKKSDLETYNDWKTNKKSIKQKFDPFLAECEKDLQKPIFNNTIKDKPKNLIYFLYLKKTKPNLFTSKNEIDFSRSISNLNKFKKKTLKKEGEVTTLIKDFSKTKACNDSDLFNQNFKTQMKDFKTFYKSLQKENFVHNKFIIKKNENKKYLDNHNYCNFEKELEKLREKFNIEPLEINVKPYPKENKNFEESYWGKSYKNFQSNKTLYSGFSTHADKSMIRDKSKYLLSSSKKIPEKKADSSLFLKGKNLQIKRPQSVKLMERLFKQTLSKKAENIMSDFTIKTLNKKRPATALNLK